MTRIKSLIFALIACFLICLTGCESGLPYEKEEKLYGTHTAVLTVKDHGEIKIELYGEFSDNGWDNDLSHERGTLSMARSRDYNSASCQFFIMLGDETRLDGQYAAFGKVIEGIEILDAVMTEIGEVGSNGEVDPESQPIIEKIEILE